MPDRCVAGFCSNTREGGYSLFRFPKDPVRREQWTKQVRRTRDRWSPSDSSRLCSAHFEENCFDTYTPALKEDLGISASRSKILLSTAVPTVFPRPHSGGQSSTATRPETCRKSRAMEKRAKLEMISELLQSSASSTSLSTPATTVSKTKQHSAENITSPCYQPNNRNSKIDYRRGKRLKKGNQPNCSTPPFLKLLKFAGDPTSIDLTRDNDGFAYRREVEQLVHWCSQDYLELDVLKTVEMTVDLRKNLTVLNNTMSAMHTFRQALVDKTGFRLISQEIIGIPSFNLIWRYTWTSFKPVSITVCDASCQTDPVQIYPFKARVIVLDEDTAVHLSRTANTCGITRDHSYHTSKTNVPLPSITINDAPVLHGSRSNDVMNTQSLRELFQFCSHCHKECSVTIEGHGALFTVTQDCQSCGHHKDWRSHPPSAEATQTFRDDEECALTHETEVVVQIVSSDNECGEKPLPGMDGSYLSSSNDEEASQEEDEEAEEEMKKKRKRKSKGKDSSDEWEPSSCEEDMDSDCDSDSEEDPLTVFKEDGEGKLVVWCTQCETEASRSCSVFQHEKLFCCAECGPDGVKTYNIDILPIRFDDIISFKRHVEQEHGVKLSFTLCQECGTFFRPQKEHVCEHKVKSVVCPDCGKRFHTEIGLKAHYTTVHSENDHACKYCLKVFKTRSAKLEHEQTHPKETLFGCPYCPEKFRYVSGRSKHLKSHRGPYAWVCDVCEKGFTGSYKLRKHKLIHTGEKPFKCKVCKRSFSQLENLGTHMRLHTGEKPFLCDQCGESFTHKVSLKNHKQRHHVSALTQED